MKSMLTRRNIVIAVVVIVVLVVIGSAAGNKGTTASPTSSDVAAATQVASAPPATGSTDAAMKATMLDNLGSESTIADKIHHNPDGSLDIAVKDGVLIVASLLPAGPSADALCSTIAAFTHDPNTAAALGLSRVVIIAGGAEIAHCKPN